jgi:hypothetical protein
MKDEAFQTRSTERAKIKLTKYKPPVVEKKMRAVIPSHV